MAYDLELNRTYPISLFSGDSSLGKLVYIDNSEGNQNMPYLFVYVNQLDKVGSIWLSRESVKEEI